MKANPKNEIRNAKPTRPSGGFEGDRGEHLRAEGFEPFITKLAVAERIDVDIRSVTRLMRRGVLRHYKVGPMVRFKWSEVESDMRKHMGVGFGAKEERA